MSRRLIFTRQTKQDLDNHYVVGAGVGAKNASVRQALKRRANNALRVDAAGNKTWGPCIGFCPISGWKHPHVTHPRPLTPAQARAQGAVAALEAVYDNAADGVQLPASITVSVARDSGDAPQFDQATLTPLPRPRGGRLTYSDSDGFENGRSIVIAANRSDVVDASLTPSSVVALSSGRSECSRLPGPTSTCAATFTGRTITVTGAVITLTESGENVTPGSSVITFYDATF